MYNIIRYSQNISNGKNFRLLQCSGTWTVQAWGPVTLKRSRGRAAG
jgi:hypothetical protein